MTLRRIKTALLLLSITLLHAANPHYCQIGKNRSGYYGQSGQDQYLHKTFFKDTKNGIFIDIGAHNGIAYSNTKFFEELGWSGICIEPIPEVFEELKANRKALCIQGCISDKKGTGQFLKVTGEPEMLSGLLEKYDPRHLARIHREVASSSLASTAEIIPVNCYLLNELLEENNISHVDFLSLDTEGSEASILQSIDFSRFDIDIIIVENNFNDDSIRNLLSSKGYNLVSSVEWDDVFKKLR